MQIIESQFYKFILSQFNENDLNRLPEEFGGSRIFNEPIYGVSRGDDPLFKEFKKIVGPIHLTPLEMWNSNGLNGTDEIKSHLRIISIIFPYSEVIREASKNATVIPSDEYCVGRNQADRFMDDILKKTVKFLENNGFQATTGMLSDVFTIKTGRKIYSNWSERHYAFAAGLGTFSLHEGFITDIGCNVRISSIITDAPFEVTQRKSDEPYGNCLFYSKGTCKKCVEKCPGIALSEEGHDKFKCAEYGRFVRESVIERLSKYIEPKWTRFNGVLRKRLPPVGCGFCQFDVPCMDKNPMSSENR